MYGNALNADAVRILYMMTRMSSCTIGAYFIANKISINKPKTTKVVWLFSCQTTFTRMYSQKTEYPSGLFSKPTSTSRD